MERLAVKAAMIKKPPSLMQIEPPWPVASSILVVFSLITLLHKRVRVVPDWFRYGFGGMLLALMVEDKLIFKYRLQLVEQPELLSTEIPH